MGAIPEDQRTWSALPPLLRDSWERSWRHLVDPAAVLAPIDLHDEELAEYRRDHPLRSVLPVIERLLVEPAAEAGLIVAIRDAAGRLLWVDGARETLRRAERSAFQAGANWSEHAIGTSAPGVALATGRGVQVRQEEHFAHAAHQFSCSAAPVRDPRSGALLGVVDLTGGPEAVATHSLPLVRAAISAAEAELKALPPGPTRVRLTVLGAPAPRLESGPARVSLGLRHAEILLLLAWRAAGSRRPGLGAGELAELLYGEVGHEVALRAEIVRLRRLLRSSPAAGGLDILSRPYRLSAEAEVDAVRVMRALTAGDRRAALHHYGGQLLPASEAPGVLAIRAELSALLRESVLSAGSGEEVWRFLQLPEAEGDAQAISTALSLLPAGSPQRAAVASRARL